MQSHHTLISSMVFYVLTRAYYSSDEEANAVEALCSLPTVNDSIEAFRSRWGRVRFGVPAKIANYGQIIEQSVGVQLLVMYGEGPLAALIPPDLCLAVAPGEVGRQSARAALEYGMAEGISLARMTFGPAQEDGVDGQVGDGETDGEGEGESEDE